MRTKDGKCAGSRGGPSTPLEHCQDTIEQGTKSQNGTNPPKLGPALSWRLIQGCTLPHPDAAEIGSSTLSMTPRGIKWSGESVLLIMNGCFSSSPWEYGLHPISVFNSLLFFQQTKIKWCKASEMIYCCKKGKI